VGLGSVYLIALAGLTFVPGGTLVQRLGALAAGICAQIPSHTFTLAGQQLPLCARNTGIYVGVTSTILFLRATGRLRAARLPGGWVAVVLGLAVIVMAVDGFNSLFLDLRLPHLYQPNNLLRLATGLGTGTAMATFLVPVANGLIWRTDDARAPFGSLRELGAMLPVLVLAFFVVISRAGWLLYPLALYSTAGLVTALSLINLVFFLGLARTLNQFDSYRRLFPVFSLTVALAIVELVMLSALKTAALHALVA
jgi:uncharacterized membrane protein